MVIHKLKGVREEDLALLDEATELAASILEKRSSFEALMTPALALCIVAEVVSRDLKEERFVELTDDLLELMKMSLMYMRQSKKAKNKG